MSATATRGLAIALLLLGCGGEPGSVDERIRALLVQVERAVGERDLDTLKDTISEDYADASGRDKQDLVRLITLQTLRGGRLFALTRLQELETSERGAHARVLAALARAPIQDFRSLQDAAADTWLFELDLAEESPGLWRLTRASWRPALVDDFR